jgi:hypothetical protein
MILATLLLKVFAIDVLACPKCDGRMQRIAWTIRPQRREGRIGRNREAIAAVGRGMESPVNTEPKVIEAILDCVEGKGRPP